uniref:Reverse transcriptase domain-containing protein n=1 Tax=Panagrellus redivivus TaxID=6233 RepID=A0A7E4UNK7_PANRE
MDAYFVLCQLFTNYCLWSDRDLGIHVSDDLSWDAHVNNISKKACGRLFQLFKTVKTNDCRLLTRLFKVYVLPILEFGSAIYNPNKVSLINTIEDVQRLATRIIYNRDPKLRSTPRPSYEDRLFHLQLKKLSTRRAVIDLKFFHSILYRYSKINLSGVSFKESRTRGPKIKLSFKRAKTSVRQNAFLHRSKKQFGSLPIRIQSLEKQQDFLIAVDNFLP